jgi:hypothetical protein
VSRRQTLATAGAVAAAALLGLLVWAAGGRGEARGSVLSRGPGGWLAARRYLEARGVRVHLLDRPLDEQLQGGVLVAAFPWQRGPGEEAGGPLLEHLRRGGDLVLAYSGELANPAEIVTLEALGLPIREKRKATLDPLRWRRFAREEWDLRPMGMAAAPLRVWAPRWAPEVPPRALGLYRGPRGGALVAVVPRYKGRIWLLPADAFANARLANPGNAALLETLRLRLGGEWTFDEYHHGLTGPTPVEAADLGWTLDLVLLHLAVLYGASLLTLARRFGPAWSEPPTAAGSAGSLLRGLGALHHRLGHHPEAARRLLARVRELDRGADLPAELDLRADAADARGLVALAREVARRRQGGAPRLEREWERA